MESFVWDAQFPTDDEEIECNLKEEGIDAMVGRDN